MASQDPHLLRKNSTLFSMEEVVPSSHCGEGTSISVCFSSHLQEVMLHAQI
jgi:hypothetical protein